MTSSLSTNVIHNTIKVGLKRIISDDSSVCLLNPFESKTTFSKIRKLLSFDGTLQTNSKKLMV